MSRLREVLIEWPAFVVIRLTHRIAKHRTMPLPDEPRYAWCPDCLMLRRTR